MKKTSRFLYLLVCLNIVIHSNSWAQIKRSNLEIRIKNDNAGEFSNWLKTGDDLGETQSLSLSCNLLNSSKKYNYKFKLESTEYSVLNTSTLEPRDILFNEVNKLQFSIDNNKFNTNLFFFSSSIGLYYIQGNDITIGATGQKYYAHKLLIDPFYDKRNWIYVGNNASKNYIPYTNFSYGYNKLLFQYQKLRLNSIYNGELDVSNNLNFSGIGAKTYFDLEFTNKSSKMSTIDLELEGYYLTNFVQYQIAYYQIGMRFNFKHFACYTGVNKPIKKNLTNPLVKYNDMELLFYLGLIFHVHQNGTESPNAK